MRLLRYILIPFVLVFVSSPTWSDLELGDYADRYLVDTFSSVKNVGRILVGGLRELSVRVWIDPIKLAANNLTVQELEQALRNENISLPAGTLEANNIDLTLNLDKSYTNLKELNNLPIKKDKNNIVRLSDVAHVEFGPVSEKTLFKAQRKNKLNLKTVGIGIYSRSGASTVELSKDIKKKIVEVRKNLPDELNLEVAFNRANYVGAAIDEVYKTLMIAFILVVIMIISVIDMCLFVCGAIKWHLLAKEAHKVVDSLHKRQLDCPALDN